MDGAKDRAVESVGEVKQEKLEGSGSIAVLSAIGPGTTIDGRFVVLEKIGSGGMSVIYKATQMPMERLVALKFLSISCHDEVGLQRFVREAAATSQMDHANIVRAHAFGVSPYGPYLVMEYLQGQTLAEMIGRSAMEQSPARRLFVDIAAALVHAHERGIVHRDIKPSNVFLVTDADGTQTAKLLDFGVARALCDDGEGQQKLTQTGSIVGSLPYMSPEQCQGKPVDARSDIYSFGCLMFEVLSGRQPIAAETIYQLVAAKMTPDGQALAEALSGCEAGLREIVLKAMAPNPAERWSSAKILSEAFAERRPKVTSHWYRTGAANRMALAAPVVVAIVLTVTAAWGLVVLGGKVLYGGAHRKTARSFRQITYELDRIQTVLPPQKRDRRLKEILEEVSHSDAGHPHYKLVAQTYCNLGYLYNDAFKDNVRALEYFRAAESAALRAGYSRDRGDYAEALYQESIIYLAQNKLQEAYDRVRVAIRLAEKGLSIRQSWASTSIASYMGQLACIYKAERRWAEAETWFEKAMYGRSLKYPNSYQYLSGLNREYCHMLKLMQADPQVPAARKARAKRREAELDAELAKYDSGP